MSNQQYDKKHLSTNALAAGNLTTQRFSLADNREKAATEQKDFGAMPIQRVIKIGKDPNIITYDKTSQMDSLVEAIKKEVDAEEIGKVKLQKGNLAKLIKEGDHPFDTHKDLYSHVAFPIVPMVSKYLPINEPPKPKEENQMVLFRAMSKGEANSLHSTKQFGMYINKHKEESGIKFFATDIRYSIGLANTKNEEAHNKREKEIPYTDMFSAVVDKEELIHGLQKDIGVHKDKGENTSKFMSPEKASGDKEGSGKTEDQFREVVKRQGEETDREDHGYVLKYESGGLNFGVKAKTAANTKPHWRSPIDYFNSLVKDHGIIGEFKLVPPDKK